MNKIELLKRIAALPDNCPIWLGADSGEGWSPLEEVFICSAIDAPLDGDAMSDWESDYVKRGAIPEDKKDWVVEDDDPKDSEVHIGGPIIILGEKGTKKEVRDNELYRTRDKKAEAKQELIHTKKALEKQLQEVTKKLKTLK